MTQFHAQHAIHKSFLFLSLVLLTCSASHASDPNDFLGFKKSLDIVEHQVNMDVQKEHKNDSMDGISAIRSQAVKGSLGSFELDLTEYLDADKDIYESGIYQQSGTAIMINYEEHLEYTFKLPPVSEKYFTRINNASKNTREQIKKELADMHIQFFKEGQQIVLTAKYVYAKRRPKAKDTQEALYKLISASRDLLKAMMEEQMDIEEKIHESVFSTRLKGLTREEFDLLIKKLEFDEQHEAFKARGPDEGRYSFYYQDNIFHIWNHLGSVDVLLMTIIENDLTREELAQLRSDMIDWLNENPARGSSLMKMSDYIDYGKSKPLEIAIVASFKFEGDYNGRRLLSYISNFVEKDGPEAIEKFTELENGIIE